MVLSCRRPAGVCPLASGLPSAKQISMATSLFCAKSWGGPYGRLPVPQDLERLWHRIAFRRLLVAQTLLLRPQSLFWPGRAAPHASLKRVYSSFLRSAATRSGGVAVSLRFVAAASALCAKAEKIFKPARRLRANPKP